MNQSIEQRPSASQKWQNLYHYFILATIFLLVVSNLFIKFISIDDPFSGNHIFRQLQTLSTIEAYQKDGIDLLKPRANYIGYPGYLLLEFPLFQATMATFSQWTGRDPLVVTRSFNIIIGLLTALMLYFIARIWVDRISALGGSILYLFTPLNMMYHWSTLLDPTVVFCSLVSFYLCYQLIEKQSRSLLQIIGFTLCSCMVVLMKPLYYLPVCLLFGYVLLKPLTQNSNSYRIQELEFFRSAIWGPVGIAFIVMVGWMIVSRTYSSAQDISSHIGWQVMLSPGYYVTIGLRYFFYIQTPIVLLLGILGYLLTKDNPKLRLLMVILLALPGVYYLLFANINAPHDYYSLILTPYLCIVAAIGLQTITKSKPIIISFLFVLLGTILGSYLFITNYWLKPHTQSRYAELQAFSQSHLDPYQYSLVYVNSEGDFSLGEYLAESRRNLILASIGKLDEVQLRKSVKPIYAPPTLYALNHQYGEMNWKSSLNTESIEQDISRYEGNLRYMVFYLFDEIDLPKNLPGIRIHDMEDIYIYDLAASGEG